MAACKEMYVKFRALFVAGKRTQKIVIQFERWYYVTRWRSREEIYVKFRAFYCKKRQRDETATSRDGILSQTSLTGCVICYREKKQKLVIQF